MRHLPSRALAAALRQYAQAQAQLIEELALAVEGIGEPLEVLEVADVAGLLGVSKATVYRLCSRGELAHVQVGGRVQVLRQDAEAYLLAQRTAAPGGRFGERVA